MAQRHRNEKTVAQRHRNEETVAQRHRNEETVSQRHRNTEMRRMGLKGIEMMWQAFFLLSLRKTLHFFSNI